MLKKLFFWLENARVYSSPITILNWLVIFVYSLKHNGNITLGIIALIGICLVHLATNLADDYFDYKILCKDENYLKSAQNCKCKYLRDNKTNMDELKWVIILFLSVAAVIGGILFFFSRPMVALLAVIALFIALFYSKMSRLCLGELAVILAYGPLMYEGVYYVMTGSFSTDVLLLSLACAFFTNTILYVHMLMDFDGDECAHKKTLCRKFNTKENALKFVLVFYLASYVSLGFLSFKTGNYFYLLPYLTLPMIIDLYNSMKLYNKDNTNLPKIYPWHYPLDNWKEIQKTPDAPFYFRFFYSRNITTFFMIVGKIPFSIHTMFSLFLC